jgi:hypothetical protein
VSTAAQVDSLAGPAGSSHFAAQGQFPQNQVVRQEVALGLIRELVPNDELIGLDYAPMMDVEADDVIFDYARGASTGLAPARAEDAESELFQQDEFGAGQGRARILDWALKSRYSASDITRYREYLKIVEQIRDTKSFPLTINSMKEGFDARVQRDTVQRKRRLDNRINWLITQALDLGSIVYNDGKIKWSVDYGRPVGQQDQAPTSGTYASTTHDPINDLLKLQEDHYDLHGTRLTRAICSRKFLNSLYKSAKFLPRTGFAPGSNVDPKYVLEGWGPQAAIEIVQRETGITFRVTDGVYRTRVPGSTTFVNNRWIRENSVIFLPDESDIAALDDTPLGFGKTLTSPHPMGGWSSGFYYWEKELTDPWSYEVGSGIKAFPVFPHLKHTVVWSVTL